MRVNPSTLSILCPRAVVTRRRVTLVCTNRSPSRTRPPPHPSSHPCSSGQHVETFSALCKAVLPPEDWQKVAALDKNRSIDSIGAKAQSVAAMRPKKQKKTQSRNQRNLGKIAALCIKQVCCHMCSCEPAPTAPRAAHRTTCSCCSQVLRLAKAGPQDMAGVLQLALHQRELNAFIPSLTGNLSTVHDPLFFTVAKAWRVAMRIKDAQTATQLLSLLVVQPPTVRRWAIPQHAHPPRLTHAARR